MKNPTFKEQYDKVVGAYLRDELRPSIPCACFIGNILNNRREWTCIRDYRRSIHSILLIIKTPSAYDTLLSRGMDVLFYEANNFYTPEDIVIMESNFLNVYEYSEEGKSEQSLFKAMESTLLMLKKIHESQGEIVEQYDFSPRILERA